MPEAKTQTIQYTRIFERNRDSKKLVIINVGGARSSKSWSILQLLISHLFTRKKWKIGICRKTMPSLRMSTMLDFFSMLKDYGLYDESCHNKTECSYTNGSSSVRFFGLDESDKIKSTGFNEIFCEEANEFDFTDYIVMKTRLSNQAGPGEMNHMYLALNPTEADGWIPNKACHEQDVEVIKSNYLDNPFLSKEYIKSLTDLMFQDENFYRVYALGEWGRVEGKIFKNYEVVPELPTIKDTKWAYGLDFGLNNPSALVKVAIAGEKVYCEEFIYQSGLTVKDIIEKLTHLEKGEIFFDPSALMMGEEIYRAGYQATKGHKGVKESIDMMQRQKLVIPQSSVNLIKEIQGYVWRKNPADSTQYLPEPVKINDHALDAARYALWGLIEKYGNATLSGSFSSEPIKSVHFKRGNTINRFITTIPKSN